MIESAIAGALSGLIVAIGAVFLMEWGTRMHVRRMRFDLDDVLDRLMRDDKRRASAAAQLRRHSEPPALNALDAALVAKHVGGSSPHEPAEPAAWFDGLVRTRPPKQ